MLSTRNTTYFLCEFIRINCVQIDRRHFHLKNLLEHTMHTLLTSLTRMLKDDIRKVNDQGKLFERLSTDYDIGNYNEHVVCFSK
jgi:hypothetical protein